MGDTGAKENWRNSQNAHLYRSWVKGPLWERPRQQLQKLSTWPQRIVFWPRTCTWCLTLEDFESEKMLLFPTKCPPYLRGGIWTFQVLRFVILSFCKCRTNFCYKAVRQHVQVSVTRFVKVFPLAVHLVGHAGPLGKWRISQNSPPPDEEKGAWKSDRQGKSFTKPFNLTLRATFLTLDSDLLSHSERFEIWEIPPVSH